MVTLAKMHAAAKIRISGIVTMRQIAGASISATV
jgi:hypothetical protein